MPVTHMPGQWHVQAGRQTYIRRCAQAFLQKFVIKDVQDQVFFAVQTWLVQERVYLPTMTGA